MGIFPNDRMRPEIIQRETDFLLRGEDYLFTDQVKNMKKLSG